MRGLEKKLHPMAQTHTQTSRRTWRLWICLWNSEYIEHRLRQTWVCLFVGHFKAFYHYLVSIALVDWARKQKLFPWWLYPNYKILFKLHDWFTSRGLEFGWILKGDWVKYSDKFYVITNLTKTNWIAISFFNFNFINMLNI